MQNAENALEQSGTNRDSLANETRSADHLLTTPVPDALADGTELWSPDLIIYHDKCADGIVAAWACWRRWGDKPQYVACNYGMEPPAPEVLSGKNILIVDFSFPADVLRAMVANGARSIVILDHHKTAQAALEPFSRFADKPERFTLATVESMILDLQQGGHPPICALFDMNRSGARMAWDFAMGGEPGVLVIEAERYDLWLFPPAVDGVHDDAEALHVEIQSGAMTVERMEVLDGELSIGIRPFERGRAILRWKDQLVLEIAARAHRRTVAGVPGVIAVECPYSLVSAVGHHLLDQYPDAPFAAMSVTGEAAVTWSLRSHDDRMDVSEVAKSMGGGGHRNAAGFRVDTASAASLHEMISEIAADLASREPFWTAGMLADALITRGVGRHADIEEDRANEWRRRREAEGSRDVAKAAAGQLLAENDALKAAVLSVVSAVHSYLPPGGIAAKEFASQVIEAVDNPTINPIIAAIENRA